MLDSGVGAWVMDKEELPVVASVLLDTSGIVIVVEEELVDSSVLPDAAGIVIGAVVLDCISPEGGWMVANEDPLHGALSTDWKID